MDLQRKVRMKIVIFANAGRLRKLALAVGTLAILGAGPAGDDARLAD